MDSTQSEATQEEDVARLAEVEQANLSMDEQLAIAKQREDHMLKNPLQSSEQPNKQEADKHSSRRHLLGKGLVAAVAALGAGALLNKGTASAHTNIPEDNVGNFSSSNASVPAVTATGTNGAVGLVAQSTGGDGIQATGGGSGHSGLYAQGHAGTGVYATSDTDNGLYGWSGTSNGLYAQSANSVGAHIIGGGASPSTPSFSEAAIFAEGGPGYGLYATSTSSKDTLYVENTGGGTGNAMHAWNNTASASALYAEGHAGAGVYATSDRNNGVYGWSGTGVGIYATTTSGQALVANGPVQVLGNSVGQATLPAGAISVTVTTSAATASSNVLLTPLGKPAGFLWVTRAAGSFTIHSSKASTSSLSIAYLIIN